MRTTYIFALDFDGVICDSARETAASGWVAGSALWPNLFRGPLPDTLAEAFCSVRPVLKTGYESLILLRLLVNGHSPDEILVDYLSLKQQLMTHLCLNADALKAQFGAVRDDWLRNDPDAWLAINSAYPGTIAAINRCKWPIYIVTTKQKRFTQKLVQHFGMNLSAEGIYGLEAGAKADTLAKLLRTHKNSTAIFIEDNIQSLENKRITKLKGVRRIFARWGYSTPENRNRAEKAENITPITLAEFSELLDSPRDFPC